LFDRHQAKIDSAWFKNLLLPDYKKIDIRVTRIAYRNAIQHADLVLPDGIALQIFYFLGFHKRLPNLNGTDFCPKFLAHVQQHHKMNLVLYGTYPDLLAQTKIYLEKKGYAVSYTQDGYSNLDRKQVEKHIDPKAINVLLVARSNIDFPIQEIRSEANQEMISKHKLIVLNQ
jgi:UDP-N-acetyl-D-mannosaminuronic acid transferase (WecB/TagA/CpsF family)